MKWPLARHDERSTCRVRQVAYAYLIAVSVLLLVPLAVLAWVLIHGFEGGVTPNSQSVWRPLVVAQLMALLAYHSLGPGHFWSRSALFAFGFFLVETTEILAFYMFSTFEISFAEYWASNINISLFFLFIPIFSVGFALHVFRFIFGALRFEPADRVFQFSIWHLLELTFIAAVVATWFTSVVDDEGLSRIQFYFQHKLTFANMVYVVGSVVLVFSKRWWLGGIAVIACFIFSISTLPTTFPYTTVYWLVVLNGTFIMYLAIGLRLHPDRLLLATQKREFIAG